MNEDEEPTSVTLPAGAVTYTQLVSFSADAPQNPQAGDIWIDVSGSTLELQVQLSSDIARIMGVPPEVVGSWGTREPRLPRWWLAFIRIGRAITDRL